MPRKDASQQGVIPIEHVALYKTVHLQVQALLHELRELSKKQPDGKVNKFKLSFINEKLADANGILGAPWKPLRAFDQFDVDDLPSNSDVVLILSQYVGALKRWEQDNQDYDVMNGRMWRTNPPMKAN